MSEAPYQSAHRMDDTVNVWLYVDTQTVPATCYVSSFWLPNGSLNVVWNLVTLNLDKAGVTAAHFAENGIVLLLTEATRVTVLQERRLSETQYWMHMDNFAEVQAALLSYAVVLTDRQEIRQIYDPTIIVSQDPILPPGW